MLIMPRFYTRTTNRGDIPPEMMLAAAKIVKLEQKSIRSVAKEFGINFQTLRRYCQKFTTEEINNDNKIPTTRVGYNNNRMVLTPEIEEELVEYLKFATDTYMGLTRKDVAKFAFEIAHRNKLKMPESWVSQQKAGKDWYYLFMKRHPNLSLRSPEGIEKPKQIKNVSKRARKLKFSTKEKSDTIDSESSSSDDNNAMCIYCLCSYKLYKEGEKWVQNWSYEHWADETCVPKNSQIITFICENCDSDSDK